MVIIWDKQPDRQYSPLPVEALDPLEELSLDADEGLVEEVKTATVNPAYKGFGS